MLYETNQREREWESDEIAPAPLVGALPAGLALTERAVAALRAYLLAHDLAGYRIFYSANLDLHDIDTHLKALGEPAAWEAAPAVTAGGEAADLLGHDDHRAWACHGGFLRLDRHRVVLARWFWAENGAHLYQLWLCAAPSSEECFRLRRAVDQYRHARGAAVWTVIKAPYEDGERVPRDPKAADDLLLPDALRRRLEVDVVGFFGEQVAALYRGLGVPYRRGVLLYGPPGNGKTSMIRAVGAALPQIPAIILRPGAEFDSDDLEAVLDRWRRQAPGILVIEDLNWLLKSVNVSTFLNLLDGIESKVNGGLMLIATTNYPEQLDPAVNNRPGRFDVVIEVPCPTEDLRRQFLARKLPGLDPSILTELTRATDGMSFAHLEEVMRLSGLMAIGDNRPQRTPDDLLGAARTVRQGQDDAERGFAPRPEVPFGLAALRAVRK